MKNLSLLMGLVAAGATTAALAGNVQVVLEDGRLRVRGDEDGNRMFLLQLPSGNVLAIGNDGTTINGQRAVGFPPTALVDVRVTLGGGRDTIALGGLVVGNDIIINTGDADDAISQTNLPITVGRNMVLRTGAGGDSFTLDNLFIAGDLDIADPAGVTFGTLTDFQVTGNVNIVVADADGAIILTDGSADAGMLIDSSTSGGSISVNRVVTGPMTITMGGDISIAQVSDATVAGDFVVQLGEEFDAWLVDNTEVSGDIVAETGGDDDLLFGANVNAAGTLFLDGGDGIDSLTADGLTGAEGEMIINIEIVE
ncbi:MAG: hypothetical protein AAFX85_08420 [Pseudomonadota bacterium]